MGILNSFNRKNRQAYIQSRLLRLGAAGMFFMAVYPYFLIVKILAFHCKNGLLSVAAGSAALLAGFVAGSVLPRINKKFNTAAYIYATAAVPLFIVLLLFGRSGILRLFFEAACVLILYAAGIFTGISDYSRAVSRRNAFIGLLAVAAALAAALNLESLKGISQIVYVFIYSYIFLFIYVLSRKNLQYVFTGRGIDAPDVRKDMAKHNTRMAFAIFFCILLLINFRAIAVFIMHTVSALCVKIARVILYILSLLFKDRDSVPVEEGYGFIPFDPRPPLTPAAIFILCMAVSFLAQLALYKLMPVLFKNIWKVLLSAVALFKRLFRAGKDNTLINDGECTEIVEIVRKQKSQGKQKSLKRTIEEMLRLLEKTPEPGQRVRIIYSIVLELLRGRGVPIEKADTTHDIYTKAMCIREIGESLEKLTRSYDSVRYGAKLPADEELPGIQGNFTEVKDLLLKQGDATQHNGK